MNLAMTLKRMPTVDILISDVVPINGEIIMDATSNKLKIGDGKTQLKNLPWVKTTIDSPTETNKVLDSTTKQIIESNIDLIEENRFNELLDKLEPYYQSRIVETLIDAGVDVKSHLFPIPPAVQHLFIDNTVYVHDYSRIDLNCQDVYTSVEIDEMINQITNEVVNKINKVKEKI